MNKQILTKILAAAIALPMLIGCGKTESSGNAVSFGSGTYNEGASFQDNFFAAYSGHDVSNHWEDKSGLGQTSAPVGESLPVTDKYGNPIQDQTRFGQLAFDQLSEGQSYVFTDGFFATPILAETYSFIYGKSYPDTGSPEVSVGDLVYLYVLHVDKDGATHAGEMLCHGSIAYDLLDIFYNLYIKDYPIEKIRLVDEYDADDETSIACNNTSCFNYRPVVGQPGALSRHALGLAVDINPLYNPYVNPSATTIQPGSTYADRSQDFPYKVERDDVCYRLFISHGFTWGGDWRTGTLDYQHFEK